jgi:transcriptional regulator with XRE-family HTH domain
MSNISDIMKKTPILPISARKVLPLFGEQIKLARLRRQLSAAVVAERAGISRSTLGQIEKGSPSVALGAYYLVLFALGLEKDLLAVAQDDVLGRKLQDAKLIVRKRAAKTRRVEST